MQEKKIELIITSELNRAIQTGQIVNDILKVPFEINPELNDITNNFDGKTVEGFHKGLQEGKGERIYIPTEAGMPILEAGKAKN